MIDLVQERLDEMAREAHEEEVHEKLMFEDYDYFIDNVIDDDFILEVHRIRRDCEYYGYDFNELIGEL